MSTKNLNHIFGQNTDDLEPEAPSTRSSIFILEGAVCIEVKDWGRLEYPPDVAVKVGQKLIEAAEILIREGKQKKLINL